MKGRAVWWFVMCMVAMAIPCCGLAPSIDTGECQTDATPSVTKTSIVTDDAKRLRIYGQLEFRPPVGDAKTGCHVVYRLFVAKGTAEFAEVYTVNSETEAGEIAGIDLIGFSPRNAKFAADLWLAEGDGQEHRPLIYDVATGSVFYKSLGDAIQKKIHGCDQVEKFAGVTDDGLAVFIVPPSDYVDSAECGDNGIWHFDLRTGVATQVAKRSGDKWR